MSVIIFFSFLNMKNNETHTLHISSQISKEKNNNEYTKNVKKQDVFSFFYDTLNPGEKYKVSTVVFKACKCEL